MIRWFISWSDMGYAKWYPQGADPGKQLPGIAGFCCFGRYHCAHVLCEAAQCGLADTNRALVVDDG